MEEAVTTTPRPGEVLDRIERELRDIWKVSVPGELPKSRACTMNLVVVAATVAVAEAYTSVVDDVTRGIPARAIVVALDGDAAADALEGEATAVCWLGDAGAVCSERVRLTARGAICARIASAVEALCVPEMPTTLVWLGRVHVDDPVFLSLAASANRIVLDTEYTSLGSLLHLARWSREEPTRPNIADLAWTRLALWQELCARFFDSPELREHATRVTKLTIVQASEPGARLGSEGALLLGWLATRLGWKPARLGGTLRFQRADGGVVVVTLGAVPRPTGVAPAALASVTLEAERDGVTANASILRELASGLHDDEPDQDILVWRLTTRSPEPATSPEESRPGDVEQRVRLRANRGARLLERTLHRPPCDPALNEAASFAEQVIEDDLLCR